MFLNHVVGGICTGVTNRSSQRCPKQRLVVRRKPIVLWLFSRQLAQLRQCAQNHLQALLEQLEQFLQFVAVHVGAATFRAGQALDHGAALLAQLERLLQLPQLGRNGLGELALVLLQGDPLHLDAQVFLGFAETLEDGDRLLVVQFAQLEGGLAAVLLGG